MKKKHIELVFGVKHSSKFEFQAAKGSVFGRNAPREVGDKKAFALKTGSSTGLSCLDAVSRRGSVGSYNVHFRGLRTAGKTFMPLRKNSSSSTALLALERESSRP